MFLVIYIVRGAASKYSRSVLSSRFRESGAESSARPFRHSQEHSLSESGVVNFILLPGNAPPPSFVFFYGVSFRRRLQELLISSRYSTVSRLRYSRRAGRTRDGTCRSIVAWIKRKTAGLRRTPVVKTRNIDKGRSFSFTVDTAASQYLVASVCLRREVEPDAF